MFKRFIGFTFAFVLAFSFSAHSTIANLKHITYAKHNDAPENTTSVSKSLPQSIINLLTGQNSAVRLTSQNYRLTPVIKPAAAFKQAAFTHVNCLKYISWGSKLSFSRFRKLVLFPFHAFW